MVLLPQFIDKARKMAFRSSCKNYRVGAVLAKGNFIIGCGRNRMFTSFERVENYLSLHGEMDALLKRRADVRGATIYVCVINQRNNDVVSKPCSECWAHLRAHGVRNVVYSDRGQIKIEKLN